MSYFLIRRNDTIIYMLTERIFAKSGCKSSVLSFLSFTKCTILVNAVATAKLVRNAASLTASVSAKTMMISSMRSVTSNGRIWELSPNPSLNSREGNKKVPARVGLFNIKMEPPSRFELETPSLPFL
jgi:hypothetical protein